MSQFAQVYKTAIDSMEKDVNLALLDRLATVEAADTIFTVPPGGNVSFSSSYEVRPTCCGGWANDNSTHAWTVH